MKILVAGGAGFIGSHLCDRLMTEGHNVTAIDSLITGNVRNVEHLLSRNSITGSGTFRLAVDDITTRLPLHVDIWHTEWDRIYNLASPASPIDYASLPFETLYAGSDGTRNLLELAHWRGARFLQASTSEVYGDPAVHPQTEDYWGNVNPVGPRSVYDEAKRYAESLTMAFRRHRGVDVRIARIFNTFGPHMRQNDGRAVPAFIIQGLRGEPLTVFGDGSQTRSLCFVSDLTRGLEALMESDLEEPCNLGNPEEITMLQLAEAINELTGNEAGVTWRPLPQDDPTRRCPDITRARTRLGWEPTVHWETGLHRTVEWVRSAGEESAKGR